jgi:hypothetical protein
VDVPFEDSSKTSETVVVAVAAGSWKHLPGSPVVAIGGSAKEAVADSRQEAAVDSAACQPFATQGLVLGLELVALELVVGIVLVVQTCPGTSPVWSRVEPYPCPD